MKKAQTGSMPTTKPKLATLSFLIGAIFASPMVGAAAVDISNTPLANTSDIAAKPNIMLILDDSGSMDSDYMPDDMSNSGAYGFKTSQCNGVAYNPSFNYSGNLPKLSDGTSYPHADFTAVLNDGYSMAFTGTTRTSSTSVTPATGDLVFTLSGTPYTTTAGSLIGIANTSDYDNWMWGTIKSWSSSTKQLTVTVTKFVGSTANSSWTIGQPSTSSLNNSTYYTYKSTGTQKAMSWTYTTAGLTSNTFSKECLSSVGNTPGSNVFTSNSVTTSSTEAQNYADWYAYYRKRFLMMRTMTGRSFSGLGTKYRVGFTTISNKGVDPTSSTFLDIALFDDTQKAQFFKKLYGAGPGGNTPLRAALSKIGRYYANKMSGQKSDPMQYACQRNYTMLSTDGYWNTGAETTTYGALKLDGSTAVGQQDGAEDKPMWDGTTAKVTGPSNTLADVAEYYYVTDLRTSTLNNCTGSKDENGLTHDVCNNEVPPNGLDVASTQHMTTFTMGLGVNGTLVYDSKYLTQTSGSYYNLKQGTVTWPSPVVSSNGGGPTNVDDLWHAAVNGRGQYFATTDPTSLSDAINTVLTAVSQATGSSAAASTTSLMPVSGDNNMVFVAKYTTLEWSGNLEAFTLDADTGAIGTTASWSVQGQLDNATPSARQIYYLQPGGVTTTPRPFTQANLQTDGYGSYFSSICTKTPAPAQCTTMTSAQKSLANDATNLVNYLRGDKTYESYSDTSVTPAQLVQIYRARAHRLGDIVNAAPVYVGKPPLSYSDSGYSAYVTAQKDRKPMVYVAANDGMLHAFSADTSDHGAELWAYVPTFVMANMYKLADTNYANSHQYFVDGSPVVSDINVNGTWKTILVAGLNSGGRGYYCLDITNPSSPKTLWEFTDTNMGLTYGNPIITKRKDGTWVVAFTSGYNNTSGDGNGHLYVVNANTGVSVLTKDIPTYTSGTLPAGTSAAPSGLGKLEVWLDDAKDNTAARYYAGDLLGNLWRFDIDGIVAPNRSSMLLANFTNAGVPQPITTRPLPAMISYGGNNYAVVAVGTGQYLGVSDIADKSVQSLYVIKDPLTATGWGSVRGRSDLVTQTLTETTGATGANINKAIRKISSNTVDWAKSSGWKLDFDIPTAGERIAVDMVQQFNMLTIPSTIPGVDECHPSGGKSWLYTLSLVNAAAPPAAPDGAAGTFLGNSLAVGVTVIETAGGTVREIVQMNNGSTNSIDSGLSPSSASGSKRRTSWRELTN